MWHFNVHANLIPASISGYTFTHTHTGWFLCSDDVEEPSPSSEANHTTMATASGSSNEGSEDTVSS